MAISDSPILITDDEQYIACCERCRQSTVCAVDTEFFWEKTYLPQAALVQLAVSDFIAVVDLLAVQDHSALGGLLADQQVLKVFHSPSQDLPILARLTGCEVTPLFDTQVGGALSGQRFQISFAGLVSDYLGLEMDKTYQRTNWLNRPLCPAQFEYAADDVRLLVAVYPLLRARLEELGRYEWAQEDSTALAVDVDGEMTPPAVAYLQIRGHGRLSGRALACLQRLAAWRELRGQGMDLRPRRLMPDALVLAVAANGHFGEDMIRREYRSVQQRLRSCASEIEAIIEEVAGLPEEDLPQAEKHRRPTPREKRRMAAADAVVSAAAESLAIPKEALATNGDVSHIVRHLEETSELPQSRLLSGWRDTVIGSTLREALD